MGLPLEFDNTGRVIVYQAEFPIHTRPGEKPVFKTDQDGSLEEVNEDLGMTDPHKV